MWGQRLRVVAALGDEGAQLRVAEIGEVDLVELQVSASRIRERVNGLIVRAAEVAIELVEIRIDGFVDRLTPAAEVKNAR